MIHINPPAALVVAPRLQILNTIAFHQPSVLLSAVQPSAVELLATPNFQINPENPAICKPVSQSRKTASKISKNDTNRPSNL